MAICSECEEEYSEKRKALGYSTCLECGNKKATQEIERKAKCVAPAFNKGAYTYISSKDQAKDIGR